MTLTKRLRTGASAFLCCAAVAFSAAAEAPTPLTETDAQRYAAAFAAVDRGDFIDAQMQTTELQDKSLLGYLSFRQLMHPNAHKASFDELSGWLARFRDLPLADRIFTLASRRKPADAAPPPAPVLLIAAAPPMAGAKAAPARPSSDRGRAARDAFYSGDAARALKLAQASGETWIAGLAAWRLNDYADAQAAFREVADDETEDGWLRAAGAYWASRATMAMDDPSGAMTFLRQAAGYSETFYGMIAERQVRLQAAQARAPTARLTLAAYRGPSPELARFIRDNPGAHRAAALAQLGRLDEARDELRAGLTLARTAQDRQQWTALLPTLGAALSPSAAAPRYATLGDYQTPPLAPRAGFTIDKALVYAIVRQESRFDPMAVSSAGAVGLMQLMPEAAARAAGDDKLKADMSPMFDPAFNLRVGQDYVTWLMERGVGYDILRTVAAYNGGPGTLIKTVQMLGGDADSLLVIECLPAQETRNYVEKVMAGYWGYKKLWGEDARTLDAVAMGAKFIDARLDLADAGHATAQAAAKTLQLGLR